MINNEDIKIIDDLLKSKENKNEKELLLAEKIGLLLIQIEIQEDAQKKLNDVQDRLKDVYEKENELLKKGGE